MKKVKTFKETFHAYLITFIALLTIVGGTGIIIQLPYSTEEIGVMVFVCTVIIIVVAMLIALARITAFREEFIRTIKYRIVAIDIWIHDDQEYVTRYFIQHVQLCQKTIYQWERKIYHTHEKICPKTIIGRDKVQQRDQVGYKSTLYAMNAIIEWVKSTLKEDTTSQKITYKNPKEVNTYTHEEIVKIIQEKNSGKV